MPSYFSDPKSGMRCAVTPAYVETKEMGLICSGDVREYSRSAFLRNQRRMIKLRVEC